MPVTLQPFNDQDELRKVRLDHLNPLIDYTKSTLTPKVDSNERLAKQGFREIRFDESAKTVFFKDGYDVETSVNLTNIIPEEFQGITVLDNNGNTLDEIKSIKIDTATVTKAAGTTEAVVTFDWETQVKQYQDRPMVQKGTDTAVELKSIKFDGNLANINVTGDEATITVPKNPVDITAQVGTSVDKTTITAIHIDGNTTGVTVSGETLNITLPSIPSPQAFTQWFVGFYDNLGELESEVSAGNVTPVEKRSFAFIKDTTVAAGQFYDTWMYVSGGWTEAPVDPAVTYEDPKLAGKQGVFSIKPSNFISIDKNGQLDLDKLHGGHFVGFYPTMDDLKTANPTPIVDHTFAFVFNTGTNAWLCVKYSRKSDGSGNDWETFGPHAALGLVEESTTTAGQWGMTQPIYGFKKNASINVGPGGVAEILTGAADIKFDADIYDADSKKNGGPFNKIRFVRGINWAVVDKGTDTLTLEHPQRVINYNSTFEANHNTQDWKGNIFYDDTSNTWMGWATPAASGAVGNKWTKIAHEGMSDQVKRLDQYLPQFAPEVVPGGTGDNNQWFHTGWTYADSAKDVGMPDSYDTVGMHIMTFVRSDVNARPGERPKYRIQYGFIEDDLGNIVETHFRNRNPSAGPSDNFWGTWTKTSFTPKELEAHNQDPAAHKNLIKFHKVVSVTGKFSDIFSQTMPGDSTAGFIKAGNCNLLADNYGHTTNTDHLEVPYDGTFRIKGEIALSGFANTTYINGKWTVTLRLKKKGETKWTTVGQHSYNHVGTSTPYPALVFTTNSVAFGPNDELIVNVTFSEPQRMTQNHPNAFFVPLRSYLMIEDVGTTAGTNIAATYRQYLTDTERTGDVGVKIHYPSLGASGNIRVYGEGLVRTPTAMSRDV